MTQDLDGFEMTETAFNRTAFSYLKIVFLLRRWFQLTKYKSTAGPIPARGMQMLNPENITSIREEQKYINWYIYFQVVPKTLHKA